MQCACLSCHTVRLPCCMQHSTVLLMLRVCLCSCAVESVSTAVGSDTPGSTDGPALNATFFQPGGIEFVPQLNAWVIADTGNNRLRIHFMMNNTVATVRKAMCIYI